MLNKAKVTTKPSAWAIADLQLSATQSVEDAKEHAENQIFERGLEDVAAHQRT